MNIGLTVPQVGRLADPAAIKVVATGAEAAGYHGLWAIDRLMAPLQPRSPYPGTPDGALPAEHHTVLDPLGVLGLAAAVTERVRIGTNVLVAPWYPPVLLARSLTTLDHISAGRLDIGLGLGWSRDEYEAVGVPKRELAARLEDALDALDAIWSNAVVQHDGPYTRIAPSTIEPKPIQQPRPPLLLAAFTPAGLDRIARRADGWLPARAPPRRARRHVGCAPRHGSPTRPRSRRVATRRACQRQDHRHTPRRRPSRVLRHDRSDRRRPPRRHRAVGAHEVILDLQADARTPTELLDLAHAITSTADHQVEQPDEVMTATG